MSTQKKEKAVPKAKEPESIDPASNSSSEPCSSQCATQSYPLKGKFTLFPKLPPEIRSKTWGFASPPPTLIRRMAWGNKSDTKQKKPLKAAYRRAGVVPAFLHVCHASRIEFLHRDGVTKDHPTYMLVQGLSPDHQDHGVFLAPDYDIPVIQDLDVLRHPLIITLSCIALSACDMLIRVKSHLSMLVEMRKMACLRMVAVFDHVKDFGPKYLNQVHRWYSPQFKNKLPDLNIDWLRYSPFGSLERFNFVPEEH